MKWIIYGGNGFVGSHLVEELFKRGERVLVADINPVIDEKIVGKCEYVVCDIRDPGTLEPIAIGAEDLVVNLAATQYHTKVPRDARTYFFETNAKGTENVLADLHAKGCRRFIEFTTDMTYGKPRYLPIDTNHPQEPFGFYGQSKKAAEDICRAYRSKGVRVTIMRPRMISGPGRLGILVKLFKLMDLGLPVPTIGSGRNHYQMVSVFDCVSAIIAAAEKGVPNAEYNLGSINPPTIRELLKGVVKQSGSHSVIVPTPGFAVKAVLALLEKLGLPLMYREQYMIADEEYILDISRTVEELGWHPRFNDRDMLLDAYQSYSIEMKREKRRRGG